MSQYTIISKYGERTRQLKFKKEIFPQETIAASENCFALLLNEQEVIELLETATRTSIKKATNYGMKVFYGKKLKTF